MDQFRMPQLSAFVLCVVAASLPTVHAAGTPVRMEHELFVSAASFRQRATGASSSSRRLNQSNVRQFELWDSEEIFTTVPIWAAQYPQLLKYTTSQAAYGLPKAGDRNDCPFESGDGCSNLIYTIQDYVRHPEGSASSNALPEVLWSGELHGNERVGPTSALEATLLLLDAATCEALPHEALRLTDVAAWSDEVASARACRLELYNRGITDVQRQWLARLVSTRRIIVIPTANALGYYRSDRTENGIDPNRDFPFDYNPQETGNCMLSIAGRTVNEVFREHLVQLSLTFHGGIEVIGYEWGATSYGESLSPDDTAQAEIAEAYSDFAGSFGRTPKYVTGTSTRLVYAVQGGMEDWAYAGSWDTPRVLPCTPSTYNGYPASQTTYNDGTLRAFNMLIETSNDKIPNTGDLGTTEGILNTDNAGNGHVARNMRLALHSVDLVQPYLEIQTVSGYALSDDVVPSTVCDTLPTVLIPSSSSSTVRMEWTVGGSISVDATKLYVAAVTPEITQLIQCNNDQPTPDVISRFIEISASGTYSSTSHFSPSESGETSVYVADIDINAISSTGQVYVYASAQVDGSWGTPLTNVAPLVAPQSHIANIRTNPNWSYVAANGKSVQGRLNWFSAPMRLSSSSTSATIEEIPLRTLNEGIDSADDSTSSSSDFGAFVFSIINDLVRWIFSLVGL